jgi:hypothetical protein
VDNGLAAGAGWSHMESTMDISVSPLDPDFRAVLENEWGAVVTEDGLNYKPLRMPHIGTPGCSAQSVEFSKYDADTIYLRIAHDYWKNLAAADSPAGLWRSTDRGASWQQLYQPPAGGYEFDSADNSGTTFLEDPCLLRPDHLWFGSTSHGLMRSTDNGVTWTSAVPELADRRIRTVAAATNGANETILYVIAEKKMPRHVIGENVPLDNWSPTDYDACWRFDQNPVDVSGNSNDLSGTVAGWTDSTAEGRYAASFDGTSGLACSNLSYAGTQSKLSVSAWVQTTNHTDQVIASSDRNEYWELGLREHSTMTNAASTAFSSAEGYVSGELRSHPDWGGSPGFAVDTNGTGSVTLDDDSSWNKIIHQTGMSSNETYSVGIRFSFSRDAVALSAEKTFLALELFEEPITGAGRLALQVKRLGSNSEKYKLNFWESTGASSTGGNSAEFDETELGFDSAADPDSDDLWLQLTLTRGADAASWSAVGVISNLTAGTEVMRYAPPVFDTSEAYFSNTLYGVILSADRQLNSHVTNRVIDRFETRCGGTPGGTVWSVRDSGGTVSTLTGPRIDDGDWHHVAGVFDNGSVELYIDGELEGAISAETSLMGSGNPAACVIGPDFTGALDDLRIYNSRALNLNAARGIYLEENNKNPMPQGQLWRIRVDASGDIAEAVRLHAPLADFHDVEANPLDPSQGWVIRKAMPIRGWPYGGRELYRFSAYGETLTPSTAVLTETYQTFDVVMVNPGNTNHVLLACGGAMRYGLRWSMDGGTTWQGLDRASGGSIPSVDSWIPMDYETYGSGLHDDVNIGVAGTPFSFVPGSPEKLLWISATQGGLLESRDYGAAWSTYAAGGPIKDLGQFAVAHSDPDRWAIGLYEHGFSVTTNRGRSWVAETHHNNVLLESLADQAETNGAWWTAARVGCGVAFHPANPDIMVAAWSQKGYLLRSTDAGLSWTDTGYRNPMDLWIDVFWSRTDPNRVYAGRMRSDDAGVTWSDIGKVVISVCDSDSDLIVGIDNWQTDVTAASLTLNISTNGGSSWTSLPDPPRETVPGTANQWLVTGTGRKWNCMADALVAIDPGSETLRILLAGRSGIYEYNEVSNDWKINRTGLENSAHSSVIEPVPWMGFVVFDPRPGFEHIVYAAKQNDDRTLGDWAGENNPNRAWPGGENTEPFYRSTDGGITWTRLHGAAWPDAPQAAMIESMTVDTLGRMFAATTEGIYIFDDSAPETGGETVEFVASEGYADGELVGQKTWDGNAGGFTVSTVGTGAAAVSSNGWKKAYYEPGATGSSGTVFRTGAAFRLIEAAPAESIRTAFRIEFRDAGSDTASLSFRRLASGSYELSFFENSGESSFLNSSDLPPAGIGTTNGAGSLSDELYLELALTKGDAADGWTAQGALYNTTVDPNRWYPPLDAFTVGFTSSAGFYGSALSAGLNSADSAAAGLSDLSVERFYVEPAIPLFSKWIYGHGLSDADGDPDGDGLSNLAEYALGGNPTNANDEAVLPMLGNNMEYIYRRRTDDDTLLYWIETTTNLVSNVWKTNDAVEVDAGTIDGPFETVTNAVDTSDVQKFFRLRIEGE